MLQDEPAQVPAVKNPVIRTKGRKILVAFPKTFLYALLAEILAKSVMTASYGLRKILKVYQRHTAYKL